MLPIPYSRNATNSNLQKWLDRERAYLDQTNSGIKIYDSKYFNMYFNENDSDISNPHNIFLKGSTSVDIPENTYRYYTNNLFLDLIDYCMRNENCQYKYIDEYGTLNTTYLIDKDLKDTFYEFCKNYTYEK